MATRNRIRSIPWIVAESSTLNRTISSERRAHQSLLDCSEHTIHKYRHGSSRVHSNVPRSCFGYWSLVESLRHARDDDPKRAEERKYGCDAKW
jgi:hypothetical protein